MSKKYLVTLKPVDKFFFGGDMTFKVEKPSKTKEEDRSSDERFSSYIIKSNTFPQQTSLLGMLRFLLLSNSDYFADGKIINTDGASALIGSKSFEVSDESGTFGCIDELGACFLLNRSTGGDVYYSFLPYASEYQMAEHDSPIQGYVNGKKLTIPKLEGYTAKDGYSERVIGSDKKVLPLSDIFVEDRRIGIARNIENGKTKVSLPTLLEIANFLSVSLDDLVCDSLNKSDHVYYKQMNQLLETCTNDEKRGAVEIVASYIKVVHG